MVSVFVDVVDLFFENLLIYYLFLIKKFIILCSPPHQVFYI